MRFITERELRDQFASGIPEQYETPPGAQLTPAARQYLLDLKLYKHPGARVQRQTVTPMGSGRKPEHMTNLNAHEMVCKNHPRILLRGKLDTLESEILVLQCSCKPEWRAPLEDALTLARMVLAAEVRDMPVSAWKLDGMDAEEVHRCSHHPQEYGFPGHILPSQEHGLLAAQLNRLRALTRETELAAVQAFWDGQKVSREDIVLALNRLSSFFYVLQLRAARAEWREEEMSQIDTIVAEVLSRLKNDASSGCGRRFPAEMSARHVHLSREDLKTLFGLDQLECVREISQPGQFLSGCRVRLIGPKGILDNVAVLGPTRGATQVEISATDARTLGITAPVRLSGDLKDAAEIILQAGSAVITRKAAIVAQRHVHMTPADAAEFGIANGDCVSVRVLGSRPLILEQVPVRVTEQSALALHMDTDEANAAGAGKDCVCEIVGACAPANCSAKPMCAPQCNDRAPATEASTVLPGKLITEHDIKTLKERNAAALCILKGQIITPLARDTAKALGITLTYGGE